ncbi:uncharacterized protein LOC142963156 isoform X2 [Anarhichas minor]|uniref:uncharacterized protein LOC142963156 isoform X2 n=1 Tax=Anarhichas minor TaxID=65739 RepID=UPI003F73BC37
MMVVLLLLMVAFVCMGLSHGSHEEKYYGDTIYIRLLRKPDFVEFSPNDNSNVTILWKQGDRSVTLDKKFKMTASYFRISHLTQKDSGHYIMRDKDLKEISNYTLEVKATTLIYYRKPGDHFTFTYRLEPNSCNIYFFPESDRQPRKLKNTIVHQGKLQGGLDDSGCTGFGLLEPCGISNKVHQMSCSGRYEIRDQNDNTAFVVSLEVSQITRYFEQKPGDLFEFTYDLEPNSCNIYFFPGSDDQPEELTINKTIVHQGKLQGGLDASDCTGFDLLEPCGISNKVLQMSCSGRYEIRDQNDDPAIAMSLKMSTLPTSTMSRIGIGIGIVSLFCSCVKCCCCGKSKSKENGSETAAAEPDVQYQEYDTEPVGPRSGQLIDPSGTHDPDQPSYTVTDPLVRDHPVDLPPSYSEVSAPAEQPDAPTVPVHSDPEPTFEFKGMTFTSAPPLGSDSTNSDVYTSDKLNFL